MGTQNAVPEPFLRCSQTIFQKKLELPPPRELTLFERKHILSNESENLTRAAPFISPAFPKSVGKPASTKDVLQLSIPNQPVSPKEQVAAADWKCPWVWSTDRQRSFVKRFLVLVTMSVVFVGCGKPYWLQSVRMNGVYTPEARCDLRIENIPGTEAVMKYVQIGMVNISGASTPAFTDLMRADLIAQRCEMGGHVAVLTTSFDNTKIHGGGAGFSFGIYREKETSPKKNSGTGNSL